MKNKMIVGFELNNDFSQISFCTFDQSMPDTLSLINGAEEYAIPTALLAKRTQASGKEVDFSWTIGREVRKKSNDENSYLVDDFIELIEQGDSIHIFEMEFEIVKLLQIYIKKCLSLLIAAGHREEIVGISFTTKKLTPRFMAMIKESILEIPVFFIDEQESFFQYMIHQPNEIRVHDCLLFELEEEALKAYRLEFNPLAKPVVSMICENYFQEVSKSILRDVFNTQSIDNEFTNIIQSMAANRIITSSFLIGDGFSKDWCKSSLKELCRHGRAFQGNNLYSKGACYHAREKIAPSTLSTEYIFLGADKLKINVGMQVCDRGKDRYLPMLNAGINWYEAEFDQDFILAYDNTLRLIITPLDGGQEIKADITLDYFQIRRNSTNRINLKLKMKSPNCIHVEIKDMGFGEIFASKGAIWQKDIEV